MNKLTKIGLNAMVAFTLMFATTVVVAQEKVVASDNLEVAGSVEAKVLNETVQQMKSDLPQKEIKKVVTNKPTSVLTVAQDATASMAAQWFIYTNATSDNDPSNPENYEPYQPGPNDPAEPDCTDGNEVCAVNLNPGANPLRPDETELELLMESDPTEETSQIKFKFN